MDRQQEKSEEELATEFRVKIFKLNGLLLRAADYQLREDAPTRAGSLLLATIVRHGGPITASRLAEEVGQTRQGVGRMVNKLVKDGFLQYAENPYHRGSRLVSLTPKGEEAYEYALEQHNKLTKKWPFPVDREALGETVETLDKIIEHLVSSESAY
ncbi:MarR family transcriptional regulator [Spongiibacter sp. KMU-166]|uniref:MarR family transcriptional regulator n=1 Tax=Spongiibacter thalassae TaxID=2721624 RepID=A0ABX1GE89_9GAMM|nr:MarR family transcriptional regulator [Spongiibacter thalassae]NKI16569.1 MarR family transcriptional regulator [Spongiibacter thalassae]